MVNSSKLDEKTEKLASKNLNMKISSTSKHKYLTTKNILFQLSSDYNRTSKLLLETRKKVASIKWMTKENDSDTSSNWLVKTGLFFILVVPEPIISDIIGATLLAAGMFKEEVSRRSCLRDVYYEVHRNLQNILKLKKEITAL